MVPASETGEARLRLRVGAVRAAGPSGRPRAGTARGAVCRFAPRGRARDFVKFSGEVEHEVHAVDCHRSTQTRRARQETRAKWAREGVADRASP